MLAGTRGRGPGFVALGIAAAIVTPAQAQPAPTKAPQEEFDYGLAEMMAGRYETGCPAIAASYAAEPLPGTLFTLAECENRAKKLATALTHYDAFLSFVERMGPDNRAAQADRKAIAIQQRTVLVAVVPKLTIELPAGAPRDLVVRRDGVIVGGPLLGVAAGVDPGAHVIRTEPSDGRVREQTVSLEANGESRTLVVELPPPPPPPSGPEGPRTPSSRVSPAVVGAAAAGAAGWLLAGVATGVSLGDKATASQSCGVGGMPFDRCTQQAGVSAGNAARGWADVATVGGAGGVAGVALATVRYVVRGAPGPAAGTASGPTVRVRASGPVAELVW